MQKNPPSFFSLALVLVSACAATAFSAPRESRVGRGITVSTAEASGTIVAEDIFQAASPVDGRLESLSPAVNAWVRRNETVAVVVNGEAAAMLDSGASADSLSGHWENRFKPTAVAAAADGLILRVFAKSKQNIARGAPLFEAARTLKLTGKASGDGARWAAEGQTVTFWLAADPGRRWTAVVAGIERPKGGDSGDYSVAFWAPVKQRLEIAPDSRWEGIVHVDLRRDHPVVPSKALISHNGAYYLPVRVSTGVTVSGLTEVEGIPERTPILLLDSDERSAPERSSHE